ncbi:MAG: hypothetical protein ACUVS7_19025 [Bryobacteraceae bacterium]
MGVSLRRGILIAATALGVFVLAVAAGLKLTPEPRAQIDYLVIGSVATFLMLGVVFGLSLALWIKPHNLLGKRRPRAQAGESPKAH